MSNSNPYPGINAHLNSLLQTAGTIDQPSIWRPFQLSHIVHVADSLNKQLPRHYFTFLEPSFEVRELDEPTKQPKAIVIRELLPQHKLGQIVVRIELLSPSNKPGGSNYDAYLVNRFHALENHIPLIEIDYLHESPSIVTQVPPYPIHPEAYPYWITVTDPRPDWNLGKARGYGFRVDEALKKFVIRLADDEKIEFDLNPVYQQTFQAGRWNDLLDYAAEPERFHTYSASDQTFIRQIMVQMSSAQ